MNSRPCGDSSGSILVLTPDVNKLVMIDGNTNRNDGHSGPVPVPTNAPSLVQ